MSTHIGDAWRAAGLLPIAMAVQCTGSIAPGPGRIRDFRHRLLNQIRAVKDQMQELGFEQELLDELDKKGEAAIDAEIEEVDVKIFQDHKINDEGRVNELRTGIRLRLRGLAARLERGYSVEVRTELPAEPTKDQKQKGASIAALSQIRFERATPLLKLTDDDE